MVRFSRTKPGRSQLPAVDADVDALLAYKSVMNSSDVEARIKQKCGPS